MSVPPKDRIFFIGPNKCGTSSFHHLCEQSGLASAHWKFPDGRFMAHVLLNNMSLGRRPFEGYEETVAFSDVSYADTQLYVEGCRFFRQLHAAYPDAFFVLNTRDVDAWLRSRGAHHSLDGSLMKRVLSAGNLSAEDTTAGWRRMFEDHHAEVRAHFSDSDRFLEFNIETDDPKKFIEFLQPTYDVDLAHWGQRNKTRGAVDA